MGCDPGHGIERLESLGIPQSTIFYAELLPIIYQCSIALGRSPVRICDIGSASGAGANLVSTAQNHLLGWPTEMTCYDINGSHQEYAKSRFPDLAYNVGDVLLDDVHFDIGIASHVIEHVSRPVKFVERLVGRVQLLVVYVPYLERNLAPRHLTRFDGDLISRMPGMIWARVTRSIGWRTETDSSVAAFVCAAPGVERHIDLRELASRLDEEFRSVSIPSNDQRVKVAHPPRLLKIIPPRTFVGVPFAVQPNGKSVLNIHGTGFQHGARILFDGVPLESAFGNPGWMNAYVPDEYYSRERIANIAVRNSDGQESNVIQFEIVDVNC